MAAAMSPRTPRPKKDRPELGRQRLLDFIETSADHVYRDRVDTTLKRANAWRKKFYEPEGLTEIFAKTLSPLQERVVRIVLERPHKLGGAEFPGGDAELADRLNCSEREIRDVLDFLTHPDIGVLRKKQLGRGKGYILSDDMQKLGNLRVVSARTCRRTDDRPTAKPDPKPEALPAKIQCPVLEELNKARASTVAPIAACPVTTLYSINGALTNRLSDSEVGTRVPTSPTSLPSKCVSNSASWNPSSNFSAEIEVELEELRKYIAGTLRVELPVDDRLHSEFIVPLDGVPVKELVRIAEIQRTVKRKPIHSAEYLIPFIPGVVRTYKAALRASTAVPESSVPQFTPPPPMPDDTGSAWAMIREHLRSSMPAVVWGNWFSRSRQTQSTGTRITVGVPDDASKVFLEGDYLEAIEQAIQDLGLTPLKVAFVVWGAES